MMAEDGAHIPVAIGGQVDEQGCCCVGADYRSDDAMEGARLCQSLAGES